MKEYNFVREKLGTYNYRGLIFDMYLEDNGEATVWSRNLNQEVICYGVPYDPQLSHEKNRENIALNLKSIIELNLKDILEEIMDSRM